LAHYHVAQDSTEIRNVGLDGAAGIAGGLVSVDRLDHFVGGNDLPLTSYQHGQD
jgi:hypothetical protein